MSHIVSTALNAHYLANFALVASYGLVHKMLEQRGRSDSTKMANISQLLAWEKQASLMLAIVLAVKVRPVLFRLTAIPSASEVKTSVLTLCFGESGMIST